MSILWRAVKWVLAGLAMVAVALAVPIIYVESFCQGRAQESVYTPLIAEKEFQRPEANSYLTYPEWHIVYAYEGLAEVLKTGDEHEFGYSSAVTGFWSSYCELNKTAQEHGGADFATRQTIYVIGASFTLEMALKALYEETLGRIFALIRGSEKAPQDEVGKTMAADYAAFLHQTPWYKYDFQKATDELWSAPLTSLRSWERRWALGIEWRAKSAYAGVIADAVEATGVAQLEIKSVVTGVSAAALSAINGVSITAETPQGIVIKTPRYTAFNAILDEIARLGGAVIEIAGNDDVMVTVTAPAGSPMPRGVKSLAELPRDGFAETRHILDVRVPDLLSTLQNLRKSGIRVEHVYDY
jgi:hypothetical protein